MTEQPEALRMAEMLMMSRHHIDHEAAAELRRLFQLAHDQHTELYGLRLKVMNLEHNIEVLTNAVWKACGDDEQVVNDTIESQGTLR